MHQLARFIRARGERVDLVGLSLGALVALEVAVRASEKVDRLVVCGVQVRPPRVLMAVQQQVMKRVPDRVFQGAPVTRAQFVAALGEASRMDLRDVARSVSQDSLVVCGTRDWVNLPAAHQAQRLVRRARLVRVPGGHQLNTENPSGLAQAIVSFLGD